MCGLTDRLKEVVYLQILTLWLSVCEAFKMFLHASLSHILDQKRKKNKGKYFKKGRKEAGRKNGRRK